MSAPITTPATAEEPPDWFLPDPTLVTIEDLSATAAATCQFPRTDLGNGQRLARLFGDSISYLPDTGTWLFWDGHRWAIDPGTKLAAMAATTARLISIEAKLNPAQDIAKHLAWAKTSEGKRAMDAMAGATKIQRRPTTGKPIAVAASRFDVDGTVLNVANGTVNLLDGTLRDHNQADMLCKMAPTSYEPCSSSTVWDTFLNQAAGNDRDLIQYLQLLAGATLLGANQHDVIPFVYGPPGSGKSTFLAALHHALGADYATTANIETFAEVKTGSGPREDVARLEGMRMVTASEAEHGQRLSVGLLKRIAGGDPITARGLYSSSRTFTPQMTVWFAVNNLPAVPPGEEGLWRRIVVIPFDHPATNPDPRLRQKLTEPEHAQAILTWAVAGAAKLTKIGQLPEPPAAVAQRTGQYEQTSRATASDAFDRWHTAHCAETPGIVTRSGELYVSYLAYCQQVHLPAASQKLFATRLAAKGYQSHRSATVRGWVGVSVKKAQSTLQADPSEE